MILTKIKTQETQTQETQKAMTPAEALSRLKEGNARFTANSQIDRDLMQQVRLTGEGQFPFAVVLGCVDSRVAPELVFDQGIGDIFSVRIAGNFVNDDILGSMEFACQVAGAKAIVVLGHSNCGAIMGACDNVQLGNLTGMLSNLKPAVEAVSTPDESRSSQNSEFVQQVADKNVALTIEEIKKRSPVLNNMLETGEIAIEGAMYDVDTGQVNFF
jgi:carbonic anhydrase